MKFRLAILLFVILVSSVAAQMQVDYRYAPAWWQTCTGFPDDSCKTLVAPLGQVLYEYGGKYSAVQGVGFRTTLHFLADENQKFNEQRLHSPRVPIVITDATYNGLKIVQENFAVALDFTRNNIATQKGNREDFILTAITNNTGKTKTFNPLLVINSEHPVNVTGNVALINDKNRVIVSEKIAKVRQNLGAGKTLIELEPVKLAAGETKQIIVLYDNGLPSKLADELASNPNALTNQIGKIKTETIDYWEHKSGIPYGHLTVPDKEVQDLIDGSLRNLWQAREIKDGRIAFQVGPTCYRSLWVADGAFLLETAAIFDRGADAREGIAYTLSKQRENGCFNVITETVEQNNGYHKENGLVLWTCVRHALLTQDKEYLKSIWEKLKKTVAYIKVLRAETLKNDDPLDDNLIPPGVIDGGLERAGSEYTNIYWNLAGLKAMIQAAHWLGEEQDAAEWEKEYADFYTVFQKAAERDKQTDTFGNIYLAIPMDKANQSLPQRAQWAFCQAIYPGQIFEKNDPIATGTMKMLETTLQEGIVMGTGWDIQGIWNYFAGFYGHAALWIGENKLAYQSLYAFANHASPMLVWREEQPPRDHIPSNYIGDMPHNWASAEFVELAVHLLQLDRGDELHLLEGLPPEWIQPGMKTELKDIATPFGKLSFVLQVDKTGKKATLNVEKISAPSCKGIFIHLGDWGKSGGKNLVALDAAKGGKVVIDILPK
ncbi:hypothetical protein FACS1894170_07570 [Planctomycetales bacterium]|nr:hypothetical protein FACS1894170_07570 [Planctomycetales bacterium]